MNEPYNRPYAPPRFATPRFEPYPTLTVEKLRQDAKDMRDNLAPSHPEPMRSQVISTANLLLNMIDYFEARHGQS